MIKNKFPELYPFLTDSVWRTIRSVQGAARWMKNRYSPQVQAKINPYSTCFSHCSCWFLQNLLPDFYDTLTPDDVTGEINSSIYQQFAKRHPAIGQWGASRYRGKLNQLWHVQEKYLNDKMQKARTNLKAVFNNAMTIQKIEEALQRGPVIVNTSPMYRRKRLGHIMLIVGYEPDTETWIIDDPFGDFREHYKTGHINQGNDLPVSVSEFERVRGSMAIYAV